MLYYNPAQTKVIYRNGLRFQLPASNLSPFRYLVHPDGTGTGWTNVEGVDVNQPYGLSFRYSQHIAKGVRKRINKEHEAFGDTTAGGEHLPGGCRILGIVENSADLSTGAGDASIDITQGKFIGRGIIYDQTNNALWCYTADGTTSDDPYLLTLHPDRAWNGGDVTWAGAHEFDASIDISGNIALNGDFSVDGTAIFDATGIEFGGAAGIGLFYDPTNFVGGESITLPNGLILKQGVIARADANTDVSFATAFPNAITNVFVGASKNVLTTYCPQVHSLAKTGFEIYTFNTNASPMRWFAIGY